MKSGLYALLPQPIHEAILNLELSDDGLTMGVRFPQMKGRVHTLDELVSSKLKDDDRFDRYGGEWEIEAFSTLYEFHLKAGLSEPDKQSAFKYAYLIVLEFIETHWTP